MVEKIIQKDRGLTRVKLKDYTRRKEATPYDMLMKEINDLKARIEKLEKQYDINTIAKELTDIQQLEGR